MAGFGDATGLQGHAKLDYWMIHHDYLSETFADMWIGTTWSMKSTLVTAAALAIVLLVPDTMEVTGYKEGDAPTQWRRDVGFLAWRPSPAWLRVVAAMFLVVYLNIGRANEFLYYQF